MPIRTKTIQTHTIMQILDKYVKKNQKIDLTDIDIEGFDEKVILQMDFDKYRPDIIMIEQRGIENKSASVLKEERYKIVAFTGRTVI